MADTPEKKVKRAVVAILKEYGAYYTYVMSMGYASSGAPDILVCYKGRFIGIECKAGKNTTSALQRQHLERISTAGGYALVINEDNLDEVRWILAKISGDDAFGRSQVSEGGG